MVNAFTLNLIDRLLRQSGYSVTAFELTTSDTELLLDFLLHVSVT